MTRSEYALIGLQPQDRLPTGGQRLHLTVCSGTGTAAAWTNELQPFFTSTYGVQLENGSLNLWADSPIEWQQPRAGPRNLRAWELCPVVLEEKAIGVAIRGNRETLRKLEIVSPARLRQRLGNVTDGTVISVRLLPGTVLAGAD